MNLSQRRPATPAFVVVLACAWLFAGNLSAQRVDLDTPPDRLKPGEFVWAPQLSPSGPVVILVSITEQRVHAYRNGVRIAYSTVSTGKAGHETPTGVFTVLEKDADHVSNLYKGAKMPNMERLTWSGIALHAGNLPGYPASHGCVRMPLEFSRLLFELDAVGTTVVIADDHSGPREAAHPGAIVSPDLTSGTDSAPGREGAQFEWRPERSAAGPVSVLMSAAERAVYVYRNGVEIGRSDFRYSGEPQALPEGVFSVLEGFGTGVSPFDPSRRDHRWMGVPFGSGALAESLEKAALASATRIPPEFGARLYEILGPGTTIFVTNREVAPHTTTSDDFVVLATHVENPGT